MILHTISLSYPRKEHVSFCKVTVEAKTIYDTVHFFEKELLGSINLENRSVLKKFELRRIVNLHDKEGIKSFEQIKLMILSILEGKEILHLTNLPNIKLVRTKGKLILFDGHHSLLAYMFTGRTFLHEIPHLVIDNVSNEGIKILFGKHKVDNWESHVVNWQATEENQIKKRITRNMGELFDSI